MVYYIGSVLDDAGYERLFSQIIQECQIESTGNLPAGVELSVRSNDNKRILFALNLTKEKKQITLTPRNRKCAFSGQSVGLNLILEPGDVRVMLEEIS